MAKTTEAIAGFFRTVPDGEAARQALLSAGFTTNEVSFVAGDTRSQDLPKIGPLEEVGAEKEAPTDAWIGGVVGLAAGMIAVVIPGIGPLIAAGPLAGAVGGMGGGGGNGGGLGPLPGRSGEETAEPPSNCKLRCR